MNRLPLFLFLSLGMTVHSAASEDPNAAARRAVNPLGSSAVADVERVQKTNNEIAITHFTKLIQKNPKDAVPYAHRGKAYSGLKRYPEAMADYEKAIELDPKLPGAYVGRAVVRYTQEDYDGSWEDVHKAESLGGEFWPAFLEALKERSGRTE